MFKWNSLFLIQFSSKSRNKFYFYNTNFRRKGVFESKSFLGKAYLLTFSKQREQTTFIMKFLNLRGNNIFFLLAWSKNLERFMYSSISKIWGHVKLHAMDSNGKTLIKNTHIAEKIKWIVGIYLFFINFFETQSFHKKSKFKHVKHKGMSKFYVHIYYIAVPCHLICQSWKLYAKEFFVSNINVRNFYEIHITRF